MGFFDDISGIMRKVNDVTGDIKSAVSDAVSGIAQEVSKARYEGKIEDRKSDLLDLPSRASRYIDKQKQLTALLYYLVIPDEKKRQECQDRIKSLCGELDIVEKEFFKIREEFKFSNDNDYEKMKAESDELDKLYRPVIEKHKNISRDLSAAIDEVNNFIYLCKEMNRDFSENGFLSGRDEFSFFGSYDSSEIRCFDSQIELQQIYRKEAQSQYEDAEKSKQAIDVLKMIDISINKNK